jgi:hypothetical protein
LLLAREVVSELLLADSRAPIDSKTGELPSPHEPHYGSLILGQESDYLVDPIVTSGEAGAAVTGLESAADRRRDRPGTPADIERFAPLVLDDRDHTGVTDESPGGLGGDRGSLIDLAASGTSFTQRLLIDIHDDLLPFTTRQSGRTVAQEAFADLDQGIGALRREARALGERSRGNVTAVRAALR